METTKMTTDDGRTLEVPNVEHYAQLVRESTPGRFEGEGPETAYYWEMSCEGFGGEVLAGMEDGVGEYVELIETIEEERIAFATDEPFALLRQSDQGFISCEFLSRDDAERTRAAFEEDAADEDEPSEDEDGDGFVPLHDGEHCACHDCTDPAQRGALVNFISEEQRKEREEAAPRTVR